MKDLIKQNEGRRLEFKEKVDSTLDICKTVIAFANDAGGDLYVGIKDSPRSVIGISEDEIFVIEEKISNAVFANCSPIILPEISLIMYENKHIIKIHINRGNNPPYHLKNTGIAKGTYIRVGSTNRMADDVFIEDLNRKKNNISFDSELIYSKMADEIDLKGFTKLYLDKAGEKLSKIILSKFNLTKKENDSVYPTNALILLSDDDLRKDLFPFAKIECAVFKGIVPGNFIDQKTFDSSIVEDPEDAYKFVLRHISQKSKDYTGVFRNDRWEYPVISIREVIRNAVIHRDYSIRGSDIKVAIFEDKVEITSPGKLLPDIDFSDMLSGQSNTRNKTLAPVFKRMGIIEQWGNGLRIISDEMKNYPEIEMIWSEPGISFRVTFFKKNYREMSGEMSGEIIELLKKDKDITIPEIAKMIGVTERTIERKISVLQKMELIQRIGPKKGGHWEVIKKDK